MSAKVTKVDPFPPALCLCQIKCRSLHISVTGSFYALLLFWAVDSALFIRPAARRSLTLSSLDDDASWNCVCVCAGGAGEQR